MQSLRRVFRHSFSAYDITELLISCQRNADAVSTRSFMEARKLDVAGVLHEGHVIGYVHRDELVQGVCGDHLNQFGPSQVISDDTTLAEIILCLDRYPRLFVSVFGGIGGILTRTDLQKPPVRMWLFGMITLIEMQMTRRIEDGIPERQWRRSLSEGRLKKAEDLEAERARRHQPVRLIDCLQFSDKSQIVAQSEELRSVMRFQSKKQFEKTLKQIESLRDNLAHSQEFVSSDWQALVTLANYLDDLIDDPRPE